MSRGPGPFLQWVAKLLVRGPEAPFVLGDMEEEMRRDVGRGLPSGRVRMRYLSNALRSAVSLGQDRTSRSLRRLPLPRMSLLDLKLGLRMLLKHPGLTVVGGLAMAFVIWVGAAGFEFLSQFLDPEMGFPGDERLVRIQLMDATSLQYEDRALFDYGVWREELESVEHLGAFRTTSRTLVPGAGGAVGPPVTVAEITASGFSVAPVPPLLGRPLVDADERPGADPVVVMGHDVWRVRFGSDPDVVGRVVLVGQRAATVVGVMPERFAFPEHHDLWVPLGESALRHTPGGGPAVKVFGRLAPGVDLERAQSEVAVLGQRVSRAHPETRERLRPRVLPYPLAVAGFRGPEAFSWGLVSLVVIGSFNLPLVLFMVVVCGNVALLLFARAATRRREILIRSALGATRGRIVAQLFAEALVLGGLAAAVGLIGAGEGLRWLFGVLEPELGSLPYWFEPRLSFRTVVCALALTVLASAVAGVLPGLRISRGLGTRMRDATDGGTRFRFGGVWTAVIVGQIALTVSLPVVLVAVADEADQVRATAFGFQAPEYLSVRLVPDEASGAAAAAMADPEATGESARPALRELERRLEREPSVTGVTFVGRVPWSHHSRSLIEVEGPSAPPRDYGGHRAASVFVAPDYFDVLGAEVVEGRGFGSGDLDGPGAVLVNRPFVENVLQGQNAVGRRIRYVEDEGDAAGSERDRGPWLEIVGVVPDLGTRTAHRRAGIYRPPPAGGPLPPYMIVHVPGGADGFAPRLRAVAADVDPSLRLHDLIRVDRVADSTLRFYGFWSGLVAVVVAIGLVLSLAGIYAVMAFTVAQRTREIGLRVALGADPSRVVREIFRHPLERLALGLALGGALMGLCWLAWVPELPSLLSMARFAAYLALATLVYLGACAVPTLRALRVQPSAALRAEG